PDGVAICVPRSGNVRVDSVRVWRIYSRVANLFASAGGASIRRERVGIGVTMLHTRVFSILAILFCVTASSHPQSRQVAGEPDFARARQMVLEMMVAGGIPSISVA